jgi:hypothetical protein
VTAVESSLWFYIVYSKSKSALNAMRSEEEFQLDENESLFSMKQHLHVSKERGSITKGRAGIDQAILDDIGVESSDSDCDDDVLPVPSLFKKSGGSFLLLRSKSMGCLETSDEDPDGNSNDISCRSKSKSFAKEFDAGIGPHQPGSALSGGLRRSASMPKIQTSRSDYNRVVGEALANSPKKGSINTAADIAMMEKLLSEL